MILKCRPGESEEDYLNRVIAAAGPLTPEQRVRARRLLPPVRKTAVAKAA